MNDAPMTAAPELRELLEEADQYRHPDFDADSEKLIVRLADALAAAPQPANNAYTAWQPIGTCPKGDDKYYFLFNELWEAEGWSNVERAHWFEGMWFFDSGLTLYDCPEKFDPTMWHPDTTPAAPTTVVSSTPRETEA